jgi:peptidoglycan/LPS O-acetylase OafA/YrhL
VRIRSLDLMRFLLALSVILFHFRNFTPTSSREELDLQVEKFPASAILKLFYISGDLAVPFFWAISGAVIAFSYQSRRQTLKGFLVSRFSRLYPLHILTLLIVVIIQWYANNEYGQSLIYEGNNKYNFLLNLFFLSGYATSNSYGFNAPVWSVSVEIVTFMIYGILSIKLKLSSIKFALLVLMSTQIMFLVLGRLTFLLCLSYFAVGIVSFEMRRLSISKNVALFLILITLSNFLGRPSSFIILLMGIIYLNVILSLSYQQRRKITSKNSINSFVELLGSLSYGLYLWHIPIQMMIILAIKKGALELTAPNLIIILLGWIASTMAASYLSFMFFERPVKRRLMQLLMKKL